MSHPHDRISAPDATHRDQSGGRAHPEPDDPLRDPFALDRHRVIECTAFRRLEGKTQVFSPAHHDHFRTRLTHTLEVADIARCLAVALGGDEQLAEVITLAHDLGHPPFGHAGEAALDEALANHGGFNHNAHSLRVVEYLEHPFPAFRGLNLTAATRAGLAAHATRYDVPSKTAGPSLEARIGSVADAIAYNHHDLEDAIGAGFVGLDDLHAVTLWREALDSIPDRTGQNSIHRIRRVVLDAMLSAVMADVIATTRPRLADLQSPDDFRRPTVPLVGASDTMEAKLREIEAFLLHRVYRQAEVASMDAQGRRMVLDLFAAYRNDPTALPPRFASRIESQSVERVIADYIAGMTDRFCGAEHERLA